MTKGQGLAAVLFCVLATGLSGQCEPGLSGRFASGGLSDEVTTTKVDASLWWSGASRLIMGGNFERAGGLPASFVASYDGERWHPMGEGLSYQGFNDGGVLALAEFDVDGPGPLGTCVVAAGSFTHSGAEPVRNVAYWDGERWRELGGGANWPVRDLLVFDEDGPGPLPESLYLVGDFSSVGGVSATCAAKWDGQAWTPLLANSGGVFRRIVVFDEDGPGGELPALFASGELYYSPMGPQNGILRYRDGVWSSMGFDQAQRGDEMIVFDPDGPGPVGEWLVATGVDAPDGSLPKGLAVWDGTSWVDMPFGQTNPFRTGESLAVYDADGSGPMLPGLVGASSVSSDAVMWRAGGAVEIGFRGHDLFGFDVFPGFEGAPEQGVLLLRRPEPWTWDGSGFDRLSRGVPDVRAVLALPPSISPDGGRGLLLLQNGYPAPGSIPRGNEPLWWNGELSPAFPGVTGVKDAVLWDVPGDGADEPTVVVSGDLKLEDSGPNGEGAAYWSGTTWVELGNARGGSPSDLLITDPDGVGAIPETLIRASVSDITAFVGGTWEAIGSGVHSDAGYLQLAHFDSSGGDPDAGTLYVCGYMWSDDTSDRYVIAVLEDGVWRRVGEGLLAPGGQGTAHSMVVFDADGSGPESPRLFVSYTDHDQNLDVVSAWDGQDWAHTPWNPDGEVSLLQTIDGAPFGVQGEVLYAAGAFTEIGGVSARGMAWFDGVSWHPVLGTQDDAPRVIVFDDDEEGPLPPALYLYGRFSELGGVSAGGFERYGCDDLGCYADYNGDSIVDTRDFIGFLNDFVARVSRSDCDSNDIIDTRDFLCFLNAWNAGC
ncbi:MAG: GC-type dockerin domain-anchored protein [Phycisphaerales bacterium JB054]